jgi:type IV fimbrial biogenesis protein FimT
MKPMARGFTLVEMIVTIGIVALLLGLAVPSFIELSRNNRMTGAANDLLADLSLARTEAVKRHVAVTVCADATPQSTPSCAATNSTSFSGWIVFVDDANAAVSASTDGNATIDTGEPILRRRGPLPAGTTAKSDTGFITYGQNGFPKAVGSSPSVSSVTRIVMCDSRGNVQTDSGNSAGRAVTVSVTGRSGVTRSISDITTLGGC